MEVETVDDNAWNTNWGDMVNIGEQKADHYRKITNAPAEFEQIWDERLGQDVIDKYRIILTSHDVHPIKFPLTTLDGKHPNSRRCKSTKISACVL